MRPPLAAPGLARVACPMLERGWHPVPVLPDTKRPFMKGWNRWNQEPPPQSLVAAWSSRYALCPVGICVTERLVIVDCDDERVEVARALAGLRRRLLGTTPLVRVGRAPKHAAVYRQRVPGSQTTRHKHKLDVLAGSGQIVAGGIHSGTGRPYRWIGGAAPWTIDATDPAIPAVGPGQIEEFIMAAAGLIGPPPARSTGPAASLAGIDPVSLRLRALVAEHGDIEAAIINVSEEAAEGSRHDTARAVSWALVRLGWDDADVLEIFDERWTHEKVPLAEVERMLRGARARVEGDQNAVANLQRELGIAQ